MRAHWARINREWQTYETTHALENTPVGTVVGRRHVGRRDPGGGCGGGDAHGTATLSARGFLGGEVERIERSNNRCILKIILVSSAKAGGRDAGLGADGSEGRDGGDAGSAEEGGEAHRWLFSNANMCYGGWLPFSNIDGHWLPTSRPKTAQRPSMTCFLFGFE